MNRQRLENKHVHYILVCKPSIIEMIPNKYYEENPFALYTYYNRSQAYDAIDTLCAEYLKDYFYVTNYKEDKED